MRFYIILFVSVHNYIVWLVRSVLCVFRFVYRIRCVCAHAFIGRRNRSPTLEIRFGVCTLLCLYHQLFWPTAASSTSRGWLGVGGLLDEGLVIA